MRFEGKINEYSVIDYFVDGLRNLCYNRKVKMKQSSVRDYIIAALEDRELDGYQIIKQIYTDTGKRVNTTTLFRAIRTLVQQGLIERGSVRIHFKLIKDRVIGKEVGDE